MVFIFLDGITRHDIEDMKKSLCLENIDYASIYSMADISLESGETRAKQDSAMTSEASSKEVTGQVGAANELLSITGHIRRKRRRHGSEYLCEIPGQFCELDAWPRQIDLDCWYCGRNILGRPIPMSYNFRLDNRGSNSQRRVFDVFGVVDTWNCYKKYISEVHHRQYDGYLRIMEKLYTIFNNKPPGALPPAPDKSIMRRFSGPKGLTEKEYQEKINELNHMDQ